VFVNRSLLGSFQQLKSYQNLSEGRIVVIEDGSNQTETPRGLLSYEDLLGGGDPTERFTELGEEEAAGLCYTSGTTGKPKGVLYSHRSTFLHSMSMCMPECLGLG